MCQGCDSVFQCAGMPIPYSRSNGGLISNFFHRVVGVWESESKNSISAWRSQVGDTFMRSHVGDTNTGQRLVSISSFPRKCANETERPPERNWLANHFAQPRTEDLRRRDCVAGA
jgi:hypothetical protein